jgi:hypothetical protein
MRRAYRTDLSNVEWGCIEPHLPTQESGGRPTLLLHLFPQTLVFEATTDSIIKFIVRDASRPAEGLEKVRLLE